MKTITNLRELDELVAQQLGWIQVTLPSYQGECIQPYVPSEIAKLSPKEIEDWLFQWQYWNDGELNPTFTTAYAWSKYIIDYLHSQGLAIETWQSPELSCVGIHEKRLDISHSYSRHATWESYCGSTASAKGNVDSPINSLPLAMCLAFLKYKGIEVTLDLK